MNKWDEEKFDLITDLDLAPLTVKLSFEDRYTLANSLLCLGYKNISHLLTFIEEKQRAVEQINEQDPKHQSSYFGYYTALDVIKRWLKGENI